MRDVGKREVYVVSHDLESVGLFTSKDQTVAHQNIVVSGDNNVDDLLPNLTTSNSLDKSLNDGESNVGVSSLGFPDDAILAQKVKELVSNSSQHVDVDVDINSALGNNIQLGDIPIIVPDENLAMETRERLSIHTPHIAYDLKGNVADKKRTGRWKASPFIIVNEVAERLAYYSVAVNMFSYVILEMHESIPYAANFVTDWIGAAFVLTLLGAFLADGYLGRFKTIIIFSSIYAVGMIMLLLNASISSLRPPKCTASGCQRASDSQIGFLYVALYIIAIGTGGIKPRVSSFGADQFDETDEEERKGKYSFFNWFFFGINTGALLGITVLVYVQDNYGWVWGFGIPTVAMLVSIVVFVCGAPFYRFKYPNGSPLTRFAQVVYVSIRKWRMQADENSILYEVNGEASAIEGVRKLDHTHQYSFFDKAALVPRDYKSIGESSRWKLCTVTQVEELKSLVRVLPVWVSTIALSISFAQLATYFVAQGRTLDRTLSPKFEIPPASLPLFATLNVICLLPFYDRIIVPMLRKVTGIERGITSLQRIAIGLFVSIFAMISAATIEKRRLHKAEDIGALQLPKKTLPMSVFWLVPHFFLMGTAEVFTYVGQLEFFYDEATDGTRSLSSALFLSEIGIGNWLSTAIVDIIGRTTGGEEKGWLRNNLNESRLDLFYWVLAGINIVNFFIFLVVAKFYSYTKIAPIAGKVEADDSDIL
ncbi:hypothetical protein SUGI_0792870 [Cryptomeria japonica]|nr:hypothetical protein SUGI_0792870 [Cryptomeria japonica]